MAERIVISGKDVRLENGAIKAKLPVSTFSERVGGRVVHGLVDDPLPNNVRWRVVAGDLEIYLIELNPEYRWLKWLADTSPVEYGPEAVTAERRLATPYVIVKVPLCGGRVQPRVEVFYRADPMKSIEDELCWPNLLNVSPFAYHCTAWFCTQFLYHELGGRRAIVPLAEALNAVTHHLFGGDFNRSSEAHEGQSAHGLMVNKGLDKRVTDIACWEAESAVDPRFVLNVDWISTGLTVRKLMAKELEFHGRSMAPISAKELGNLCVPGTGRKKPR